MCTNCRYIYNHYSRRRVLVKCGKCAACKQEKACKRSNRIRNNFSYGTIALFITLTYTNDFVPYVKRDELDAAFLSLQVYRRCTGRYIYDSKYGLRFKKYNEVSIIDDVSLCNFDKFTNNYLYKHLRGLSDDYIGVCYYPDIQNFFKRLRQILIRHYNYEKSFSYFCCSELGGHSYRPHFHALIFIARSDEKLFRSAICEAWPFADRRRTAKFIEVARNAASYVSSYVNSNIDLLPLMQDDHFRPKHSQSKNFGVVLDCFKLSSILEKIDSGDLVYYREAKFDGVSTSVALPIPLYVLHRYFPICKGFGWLSSSQLRTVLLCPEKLSDFLGDYSYVGRLDYSSRCFLFPVSVHNVLDNPLYDFSPRETYSLYVRLENCYQRFYSETGLSRFDYAHYYIRCYSVYKSMILRLSLEDKKFDEFTDFYENALDVHLQPDIAPTLSNLHNLCLNPNDRSDVVISTTRFKSLYHRLTKQKDVTNYCLSNLYDL